jgi:hypothetical protein
VRHQDVVVKIALKIFCQFYRLGRAKRNPHNDAASGLRGSENVQLTCSIGFFNPPPQGVLPMKEEAKAVQEVAKATGKAIDAAREAGGFISRFVAGPLEQGIGIFEDRLRYMRWERQLRLMRRAEDMLRQLGLSAPSRPVPLKLAIPLLQSASLEEDDDLQDRWAALLVNAGNTSFGTEIRRAHLDILEQITALEAHVLDVIYSLPFETAQIAGVITAALPASAQIAEAAADKFVDPSEEVMLAISNLARLGCLRLDMRWGGGEHLGKVHSTVLGRSFVNACRLPGNP